MDMRLAQHLADIRQPVPLQEESYTLVPIAEKTCPLLLGATWPNSISCYASAQIAQQQ